MAKKSQSVPSKRGRGAPRKVTQTKRQILLAMFRERATKEAACAEAEISVRTLDAEMERDKVFSAEIMRARSFPNRVAKQSVIRAMEKDGHLALKYLERTDPEFKPRIGVDSTDEDREKQLRDLEQAGLALPENRTVDKGFMPIIRK